jgi:hypothetical protein
LFFRVSIYSGFAHWSWWLIPVDIELRFNGKPSMKGKVVQIEMISIMRTGTPTHRREIFA